MLKIRGQSLLKGFQENSGGHNIKGPCYDGDKNLGPFSEEGHGSTVIQNKYVNL